MRIYSIWFGGKGVFSLHSTFLMPIYTQKVSPVVSITDYFTNQPAKSLFCNLAEHSNPELGPPAILSKHLCETRLTAMSLRGNLVKHIVDSSLSSLQLLCCVKCILILCRSWLADFIISKMLFLESGNEGQEKIWIVFCKHTQSWWTFNYQPLSGTSWAGLQEKGKWQCGVWAPPRRSSAWKDMDWLQHKALSTPGIKRCFLSCLRTEGLCADIPFSWSTLFLCLCPFAPSSHSLLQSVFCQPSHPPHSSSLWAVGLPTNLM